MLDSGMSSHPIRIIGIDPGLRTTGWGILEAVGSRSPIQPTKSAIPGGAGTKVDRNGPSSPPNTTYP